MASENEQTVRPRSRAVLVRGDQVTRMDTNADADVTLKPAQSRTVVPVTLPVSEIAALDAADLV